MPKLRKGLREQGHEPQTVAHFVNRLVFCMFAEDVGLLPDQMFRRMLDQARLRPERFAGMARSLFAAMQDGGMVGFRGGGVVQRRAVRRRHGACRWTGRR